jgi:uncharacterized protein YegJ (DUF2314 family)
MKTLAAVVLIALVLFFLARRFLVGAGRPGSWVEADDPEILAAEGQAKSTLPAFLQRLQQPDAGDTEFMLKFRLRSGDAAEQIWAEQIVSRNGRLYGRLANKPVNRGHSFDEEVEIAETDILDWGYRSDGVMQGHFSTRALMPRMPKHAAAHICQEFGWDQP